jgi:PAS domain S-box-containing protein
MVAVSPCGSGEPAEGWEEALAAQHEESDLPPLPARPGEGYASKRLSLVGIALIIVVLAAAGAGIWDRRKTAIEQARRQITDLTIILAEETDRSIDTADRVLREVRKKIAAPYIDDDDRFHGLMASEAVHDVMQRRSSELQQPARVRLIAADGRLVNDSGAWPAAAVDLSSRNYFEYLHQHKDPVVYIGASHVAKVGNARSFFLARRIEARDGKFLGVAVADFNVDYLDKFYGMMIRSIGGSVAVFRRDAAIIARLPDASGPLGDGSAQSSAFDAVVEKGGRAVLSPARFGAAPRIVALQPLEHFGLAVAVSVPEATVLADWKRHSIFIAAGAICVAVVFGLLLRALAKQSRSLERSEAGLRKSEARFRDFALTSSDWFWETDAQHRFVYQSEEIREFGQDPRNRLGRLRIDLAADAADEPEKWREHMAALSRHEPFRNFVYERQIGGDPVHIISVSGNPVFDSAGRFLGYRGTARNITEEVLAERSLRAAKAAAESANLAKSHFLANMSHELRTPLNAILGFAELLERGAAGPLQPQGREYAGLIRQSGAHLLEVINGLLDLARIDAGRLELQEERGIDPRRLVLQCVKLVEPQADAAALHLSADVADPAPLLVADRTRLTEILLNLLSNAIKFTEPGGSVSIGMHRTGDGEALFEIRDTGIGMTGSELEIAFEPFGQVDPGLGRRSAGTGLGLPLARRFAELHGGSLRIQSEKGVGTAATLLLPAARVLADLATTKAPLGEAAAAD